MSETAFIFGAGKTGRGFAAHIASLGGYNIVLVDKNKELIENLKRQGQYDIQVLGCEEKSTTIKFLNAYQIDDSSWQEEFADAKLAFTAVFGNQLQSLSTNLAVALQKRMKRNPQAALTIITCENLTSAAHFLKDSVVKQLNAEEEAWLLEHVGFSESIIFKTCLDAAADQSPLTIRAQNFFDLPCDGDAIKEPLHVYGLKPLSNFQNQLKRKIYTYNCINAVITYLGAQKGYKQLYDAGNDEAILGVAKKAANETSAALVAEYGFNSKEQEEWVRGAFQKFSDRNIPDPIERNGADPIRKLGREDRLIGPALLALKHGVHPEGLLEGINACFAYTDPSTKSSVADLIKKKGLDLVLKEVCGLSQHEPLFSLIKETYRNQIVIGN